MEVVLPDGEIIRTLPVPTHAAGPDILQLFVGAEGSFGIITEATCKIEKIPETRKFHVFLMENLTEGIKAGKQIMLDRINPSIIRLYDESETRKRIKKILINENTNFEIGAYLVVGMDGSNEYVEFQDRQIMDIFRQLNACELGDEAA